MSEQPSRTEPSAAVPEFGAGRGLGPVARSRGHREKWPSEAVRARLGYVTATGRGPLRRGGSRLSDHCGHPPTAPAARAGAAIETTEDRA
ncbi:hypothetical protein ACFRMQ_02275 [Kitasatospora sp. NPDC056783]|uniref:hypothetical protein n=1 Tax=Kitasatospora sp. NPDC056783 TaxID=3345943 RepID=UPI00368B94C9